MAHTPPLDLTDPVTIEKELSARLADLLESVNQVNFKVIKTDLRRMKFTVELDIFIWEPDNYIGFTGY